MLVDAADGSNILNGSSGLGNIVRCSLSIVWSVVQAGGTSSSSHVHWTAAAFYCAGYSELGHPRDYCELIWSFLLHFQIDQFKSAVESISVARHYCCSAAFGTSHSYFMRGFCEKWHSIGSCKVCFMFTLICCHLLSEDLTISYHISLLSKLTLHCFRSMSPLGTSNLVWLVIVTRLTNHHVWCQV